VIGDVDELAFLFSGGIKLDLDYSPALLYELAKMDGAIVLSSNATKIAHANVQLTPDPTIHTLETGTRHRTAERVSKQTDALVVAISERREVVSLYVDGVKYILEDIPVVLAKANQALATLDKYRSRLDQVSTRLTALEFEGGVDAARRPHRAAARRAGDADGGRDRALHRRARHRGPPDRDAARRDDGRRLRRQGRARPRLSRRGHRRALLDAFDQLVRLPHQDLLDFGRLPSCSATTASSTRSTTRSLRAGSASWGAYPRCPSLSSSGSSTSSEGWRSCSPPPTASWRPSTASARSGRRTSARDFAASRRSTSLIATCRRSA
jgi:diadenylate cyclase